MACSEEFLRGIWEETNLLRTRPNEFADALLREEIPYFQGNLYCVPGQTRISTQEGPAAVRHCIEQCRQLQPLPPIEYPRFVGMNKACQDHCNDIGPKGLTSHAGSDGSNASNRLARYGKWRECCGENLSFGHSDGRKVIRQLAIDDGVPSRGHFKNLVNPQFKVMGVGLAQHKTYRYVCTINYAGAYEDIAMAQAATPSRPGAGGAPPPPPPKSPTLPPVTSVPVPSTPPPVPSTSASQTPPPSQQGPPVPPPSQQPAPTPPPPLAQTINGNDQIPRLHASVTQLNDKVVLLEGRLASMSEWESHVISVPELEARIVRIENRVARIDELSNQLALAQQRIDDMQAQINSMEQARLTAAAGAVSLNSAAATQPSNNAAPVAQAVAPAPAPRAEVEKYIALYSFTARNQTELSVEVNETVELVKMEASGWMRCRNARGQEGLLFNTYLRKI